MSDNTLVVVISGLVVVVLCAFMLSLTLYNMNADKLISEAQSCEEMVLLQDIKVTERLLVCAN